MNKYKLRFRISSGMESVLIHTIVDCEGDWDAAMEYVARSLERSKFMFLNRDPDMYDGMKSGVVIRCSDVQEIMIYE